MIKISTTWCMCVNVCVHIFVCICLTEALESFLACSVRPEMNVVMDVSETRELEREGAVNSLNSRTSFKD